MKTPDYLRAQEQYKQLLEQAVQRGIGYADAKESAREKTDEFGAIDASAKDGGLSSRFRSVAGDILNSFVSRSIPSSMMMLPQTTTTDTNSTANTNTSYINANNVISKNNFELIGNRTRSGSGSDLSVVATGIIPTVIDTTFSLSAVQARHTYGVKQSPTGERTKQGVDLSTPHFQVLYIKGYINVEFVQRVH